MRLLTILLSISLASILFACSGPSIEEDARSAADLSRISNQCAIDNDMTGAGKAYSEAQAIMEKYKNLGKFEEFYEIYNSYLQESARVEDAKIEEEADAALPDPSGATNERK